MTWEEISRELFEEKTSERFTVDSDGKWWDKKSCKYVTIDHLFDLVEKLEKENKQLKELLDFADDLIQSHLSEHFIRQWRTFKTGHKEYNDFWEEKLKKHKELKEDLE